MDNRKIEEIRENETKLIDEIKQLEKENQEYKEKYNKALELLASCKLPCDIDNFNTMEDHIEYCIKNCSVDEEIFIKCWDRFITQKIEKSDK